MDQVSKVVLIGMFLVGLILAFNSNLTYGNRGGGVVLIIISLSPLIFDWFKNYKEEYNK